MSQPKIPDRQPDIHTLSDEMTYGLDVWIEESVFVLHDDDDGIFRIQDTYTNHSIDLINGTTKEYVEKTMEYKHIADDDELKQVMNYLVERELLQ